MSLFGSSVWTKSLPVVQQCGLCKLDKTCPHPPKKRPYGRGLRGVLLVGEHPDRYEGERGSPNDCIRTQVHLAGLDMERDCVLTWATTCSPESGFPSEEQVGYCRPGLQKIIDDLDPVVIIPFGESAIRSVVAPMFNDSQGYSPYRWAGFRVPSHKPNAWICPSHHPAVSRTSNSAVLGTLITRHVGDALCLMVRPWKTPPDYLKEVEVVHDRDADIAKILSVLDGPADNPIAVDLETDGLKPDRPDATIWTCAVSSGARAHGGRTVAYPWTPRTRDATAKIIFAGRPLVASNLKFEERWFIKEYGRGADYWKLDTMLRAHWEDCRQGVTGLKYQAFVKLGQPTYNEAVQSYLEAEGGANARNRIRQAPMMEVLRYNGMDAILERMLA